MPLVHACHRSGEPITPPQTTLLKLLDSYLHKSSQGLPAKARNDALVHMLINTFFDLAGYAQNATRRALGSADGSQLASNDSEQAERSEPENGVGVESTPSPLKELDLLLPKVSEALVLVSQCLTTLALASSTAQSQSSSHSGKVKTTLAGARSAGGEGLVESLIGKSTLSCAIAEVLEVSSRSQRPCASWTSFCPASRSERLLRGLRHRACVHRPRTQSRALSQVWKASAT